VVGLHSPFKVYEVLSVWAKALKAGLKAVPTATAAPATAAFFTKLLRVSSFGFMFILFPLLL
jgi:hypothetical protein